MLNINAVTYSMCMLHLDCIVVCCAKQQKFNHKNNLLLKSYRHSGLLKKMEIFYHKSFHMKIFSYVMVNFSQPTYVQ